jgi:glutamate N-acetyltransferase/amino-acid N-acetyltransferase
MSTNDTALILANGKAGNRSVSGTSGSFRIFRDALEEAAGELARAIVRDGEGATKLIEIRVDGARTAADARKAAYAVANSNLVKTAFFGGDANWGRIISALGATDAAFSPDRVRVYLGAEAVFRNGKGVGGREAILSRIMAEPEVTLRMVLGAGKESFRLYGSDLSFDYVKINAHYRT